MNVIVRNGTSKVTLTKPETKLLLKARDLLQALSQHHPSEDLRFELAEAVDAITEVTALESPNDQEAEEPADPAAGIAAPIAAAMDLIARETA